MPCGLVWCSKDAMILIMIQTPTSSPLTCAEAKRPDRDSNAGPTAQEAIS
jgi:hypothetical protein